MSRLTRGLTEEDIVQRADEEEAHRRMVARDMREVRIGLGHVVAWWLVFLLGAAWLVREIVRSIGQ